MLSERKLSSIIGSESRMGILESQSQTETRNNFVQMIREVI